MGNKKHTITILKPVLICILLLDIVSASGQTEFFDVIRDDSYYKQGTIELLDSKIYRDTTNMLEIYDIISSKMDSAFVKYIPDNATLAPHSTYWIKFKTRNTTYADLIYLTINVKLLEADLYMPRDSAFLLQRSGLKWSLRKWHLKYINVLFSLPGQMENQDEYYYLRLRTSYFSGSGIILSKHRTFFNNTTASYYFYGIFFGIIFIAALYSMIFYIRMRELTYLYYFLYVVSFAAYAFVDFGLILNFLAITKIKWSNDLYTIPYFFITISLLLYAKSFLNLKENMPVWNIIIVGLVIVRVIVFSIGSIFNILILYHPGIDTSMLLVVFVIAIVRQFQGYRPARYLIIGFAILIFGLTLHTLRYIYQEPIWPFLSIYRTGVAEIIIFSLALADRFRTLKKESDEAQLKTINTLRENSRLQEDMIKQLNENEKLKDKVNRELEENVRERTLELEEANLKIRQMNQLLKDANIKLEDDVKRISRSRVLQKQVTFDEFREIYPDDEACYLYLEKLKWENGYTCRKCGNTKYSDGPVAYSRRCSRCNYIERITSGTIFTRLKFPITKAFYLLFLISSGKKHTVDELSEMIDLRRQTCWLFKKKVEKIMEANKKMLRKRDGWTQLIFLTEE